MTGRRPTRRDAVRREEGFTLVELLVTMAVGMIVLLAILGAADLLGRSTAASSRLTDAQELGRRAVRQMTADLRQAHSGTSGAATPLVSLSRSQLVVATTVRGASGDQDGWVAYCAAANGDLLRGTRTATPYAAPAACGSGTGWTFERLVDGRLEGGATLFTYTTDATYSGGGCPQQAPTPAVPNPPPCLPPVAAVRAIGLRVAVGDGSRPIVTRAAVSLRNAIAQ